jgi:hypothetical protein
MRAEKVVWGVLVIWVALEWCESWAFFGKICYALKLLAFIGRELAL